MQRDMDLIREILLLINDDPRYDGKTEFYYENPEDFGIHDRTVAEVAYHLTLLIQAAFIDGRWPIFAFRWQMWGSSELHAFECTS